MDHIYKYALRIIRFYFNCKFKMLMDPLLKDPFTETYIFHRGNSSWDILGHIGKECC